MSAERILATVASLEEIPTHLSAREIREWAYDLRANALFSARTTNAVYLQRLKNVLGRLLSGEINQATGRDLLQTELASLGYDPTTGFGSEDEGLVPPAGGDTLQDLSSDQRIDLILETQSRLHYNKGFREAGLEPERLWQYPAWELVRTGSREEPRDWPARWGAAGGTLVDGRMIARKDDPVWSALGSSALFDDALDTSYPPYAFNSGMGLREVHRSEAAQLGFVSPEERVQRPGGAELPPAAVSAEQFDDDFLQQLRDELDAEVTGGTLRYQRERDASREEYLARPAPAWLEHYQREAVANRVRRALAILNGRGGQPRDSHGRFASTGSAHHDPAGSAGGNDAGMDGVLSAAADPAATAWHNYRQVGAGEAERIRQATGIEVEGFHHRVDSFAARKVLQDHGNDHLPVTAADIARIPEITATADRIFSGRKGKQGLATIVYQKRENGHVFVVEEVRSGKQKLALKTMYKVSAGRKGVAPPGTAIPNKGPALTAKTAPGAKPHRSLAQPEQEVKSA